MTPRCAMRSWKKVIFFHLILTLEVIKLCRRFLRSQNGSVIGALFEIYQNLSRHNVVGFPGMPNYPYNKGFYRKTACRIGHRVSFSEMSLPHEHGSLLTKVVMFEIRFSI